MIERSELARARRARWPIGIVTAMVISIGLVGVSPGTADAATDHEVCHTAPGVECFIDFEVGPGPLRATFNYIEDGVPEVGAKEGDCQPRNGVYCFINFGFLPARGGEMISWDIESASDYVLVLRTFAAGE